MKKYTLFFVVLLGFFVFSNFVLAKDASIVFTQTLKVGSRGTDVKNLEQFLKDEGYYTGRIDGIFGKKVSRILKEFQADNNLTTSGVFDKNTMIFVNKYLSKSNTISSSNKNDQNTVNSGPVISKISGPQTLALNKDGTWVVTVTDPNPGLLTYTIDWGDDTKASGTPGPRQDASYVQTGTFTRGFSKAGLYNIVFKVVDSLGLSASTSLTVKVGSVTNSNTTLSISTSSLPDGKVGAKYSEQIIATGGDNYSWSISGTLPPGLYQNSVACTTISSCNVPTYISGTPTTPGIYSFNVDVSSGGKYASQRFTINILK